MAREERKPNGTVGRTDGRVLVSFWRSAGASEDGEAETRRKEGRKKADLPIARTPCDPGEAAAAVVVLLRWSVRPAAAATARERL